MSRRARGDRGQLVLVAAALVALALIPMALAYVGLSHHPNGVEPGAVDADELRATVDAAADTAAANVSGRSTWSGRTAAVASANATFRAELADARTAYRDRGSLVIVAWNTTAADRWADERCPFGEMRRFGECEGSDGFVLQKRAGGVHVLGVAVDVRVRSGAETATYTFEVATP